MRIKFFLALSLAAVCAGHQPLFSIRLSPLKPAPDRHAFTKTNPSPADKLKAFYPNIESSEDVKTQARQELQGILAGIESGRQQADDPVKALQQQIESAHKNWTELHACLKDPSRKADLETLLEEGQPVFFKRRHRKAARHTRNSPAKGLYPVLYPFDLWFSISQTQQAKQLKKCWREEEKRLLKQKIKAKKEVAHFMENLQRQEDETKAMLSAIEECVAKDAAGRH